ncbi:MAG: glyoxalase/bleomycin resistance/extradiol dioxygenase family protein [Anaerolineae bacterium]|nr:glyoxalase/bleomycin resistance/extradiol dioxygenase family protein [Anaerolineae bacterium]
MSQKIFVNLAVKDLNKSIEFFGKLGFTFNPQFTNENATCMVVSEDIYVMLLVESFFKTFTPKPVSNAHAANEVIISLSAESRGRVDELVNKAFQAGAQPSAETQEQSWMYVRSFQDLDGHLWEIAYMDENALPPAQA